MIQVPYADLIGAPFQYGGRGPAAYDCFGLTRELQLRLDGREIPDIKSPRGQEAIALAMQLRRRLYEPAGEPFPGAHLIFRIDGVWSHTGMLVDEDLFVHTWEQSGGVCTERLSDWSMRSDGEFYRYVG